MYGSEAQFAAYLQTTGQSVPANANIAAALHRGSNFLDGAFINRFPGRPTGGAQQINAWPRTGARDRYGNEIDPETVPLRVEYAAYEAAILEANEPGQLEPVIIESERVIREKVEGAVEVQYSDKVAGMLAQIPQVSRIEHILAPLLAPEYLPVAMIV